MSVVVGGTPDEVTTGSGELGFARTTVSVAEEAAGSFPFDSSTTTSARAGGGGIDGGGVGSLGGRGGNENLEAVELGPSSPKELLREWLPPPLPFPRDCDVDIVFSGEVVERASELARMSVGGRGTSTVLIEPEVDVVTTSVDVDAAIPVAATLSKFALSLGPAASPLFLGESGSGGCSLPVTGSSSSGTSASWSSMPSIVSSGLAAADTDISSTCRPSDRDVDEEGPAAAAAAAEGGAGEASSFRRLETRSRISGCASRYVSKVA